MRTIIDIKDIKEFLRAEGPILDVRSPGEYSQGHIPGAINLPLFTNEERTVVGTLYKQTGKEAAFEKALRLVGPKLADFVVFAKKHCKHNETVKIHCWRGGMRSAAMAWLFTMAGLNTITLRGGYKTFRKWALEVLREPRQLKVIGGLTGTGKTALLQKLEHKGEQILDLEKAACHRGSSYGMFGMPPQPSNEQFENEIAVKWATADPQRILWIEDESRMIGKCKIPDALFKFIRSAPMVFIECSLSQRLENLSNDYGNIPPEELIKATERLSRRLGGARTMEIIALIRTGNLTKAMELTLQYYDATYNYGLTLRSQDITHIVAENLCPSKLTS